MLKKFRDKTHVEWCKAWVQTLSDLQQYVRKHHTTGLVWAKSGSAPVPPPPGGMPPPPPPSMPIGDVSANVGDDRSALFAQINQGENITRSLKKVTSDMQTHKNSSIRTGPAPFKAPVTNNSASFKSVPSANLPIDKPPVFTRDGKKWLIVSLSTFFLPTNSLFLYFYRVSTTKNNQNEKQNSFLNVKKKKMLKNDFNRKKSMLVFLSILKDLKSIY